MSIRTGMLRFVKGCNVSKMTHNFKLAVGLHLVRQYSSPKTMTRKVLIPTNLDNVATDMLTNSGFEVFSDGSKGLKLLDEHPDASYLIVRSEQIDKDILKKMEKLALVVRAGAGYNTIDTKNARALNIDVMNTPGANANAVAEEVVAMILAVYRHVVPADKSTRQGKWEKKRFMGQELCNKVVGIVGLGNIGQLVAKRISGFDCRVIGFDPFISEKKAAECGIGLVRNVRKLFSESDVVTLHMPETDDTRGMVNEDILNLMKDGSTIINAARSGIIDEEALRKVRKEKKIYFCTDVYSKDAPGDKTVKDVADLMLPHLGANTFEANKNAAQRAASQIIAYADKGVRTFVVNRDIPEGLSDDQQKLAFYISKIAHSFNDGEAHPEAIEVSYYGDLHKYSDYLAAPVVMGLGFNEFSPFFNKDSAAVYLKKRGIKFTSRDVDDSKGYGSSITVDMLYGHGRRMKKISLRGTLTEGVPKISRIDEFDNLYSDPIGHTTMIYYHDRPGMLAKITNVIARFEANIEDIRCPHNSKTGCSLAVIQTNVPLNFTCLEQIRRDCNPIKATTVSINAE